MRSQTTELICDRIRITRSPITDDNSEDLTVPNHQMSDDTRWPARVLHSRRLPARGHTLLPRPRPKGCRRAGAGGQRAWRPRAAPSSLRGSSPWQQFSEVSALVRSLCTAAECGLLENVCLGKLGHGRRVRRSEGHVRDRAGGSGRLLRAGRAQGHSLRVGDAGLPCSEHPPLLL